MVQLLFGLGTDTADVNVVGNALRMLCSMLDRVVYELIVIIYQILFNIADATILSSEFIKDFYSRVQLILGVFMIFKLAISLLQAVINPDMLTDQKKGMGKIISRMIIMLVMLTAIMPLNIPNADAGSYNAYLNQNGLLFGTLYSLQARILDGNVIGKLVLGDDAQFTPPADGESTAEVDGKTGIDKKAQGKKIASYMLKVFVKINLKVKSTTEGAENKENYRCPVDDIDGGANQKQVYEIYNKDDVSPGEILDFINTSCYEGPDTTIGESKGKYALAYFPILPTICGALVLIVLVGFCIDVAIRALKIAILRLIAPIPIISYIDPASAEKGSFATWVKLLMTTYLNLFIILAMIFFVISVVGKIADGDQTVLDLPISGELSIISGISTVFIIIGIFFFAKQAPKFVMDALGIKGMGLGPGLSGVLGAAGGLLGGGGLMGAAAGFMGAANAASEAAAQGKQAPPALASQRAEMAKMITGDDKNDGSMGYRMQKALHDRAGAQAFNRLYGISTESTKAAKDKMYALQDQAEIAKNAYENFTRGNMTAQERSGLAESMRARAAQQGLDPDLYTTVDNNGNVTLTEAGEQYTASYLQDAYLSAQSSAGMAKANFEKMQKIGDRANILLTPEQEHRASLREQIDHRLHDNIIHDGYTAVRAVGTGISTGVSSGSVGAGISATRGGLGEISRRRDANRPGHQTIEQRVVGKVSRDEHNHVTGFDGNRF